MKILVVEDQYLTALATRQILQRSGHSTEVAYDAAHARIMCDHERYDLILCDLKLPDGAGSDLMRELHERFGTNGISISRDSYTDDTKKSARAAFISHVDKPADSMTLLKAISNALN